MLTHWALNCVDEARVFRKSSYRRLFRAGYEEGNPARNRLVPGKCSKIEARESVLRLVSLGNQQAQIAQVLAGGAGHHGIAERGEHGASVEGCQRSLEMKSKGVSAGHGGGVGDGAGRLGVAVDAVGTGAE